MRRIAFINEKGGTCKTTLAVNVAAYFAAQRGQKVLLVDLDTQGHAGKALGLDVRTLSPNVFHWLSNPAVHLTEVVRSTGVPNLSVLPAYKEMAEFPLAVSADVRSAHRLADKLLQQAQGYDAIFFDAPPSMGLTTFNILIAATEVVVPVALTYLALDGCAEMVETVRRVAEQNGRADLKVSWVVPTLYRKTALADEILAKLRSHFPHRLAPTLAFNVKIDEAQSHGQTIWQYAPRSKGAQMAAAIAEEIYSGSPLPQAVAA